MENALSKNTWYQDWASGWLGVLRVFILPLSTTVDLGGSVQTIYILIAPCDPHGGQQLVVDNLPNSLCCKLTPLGKNCLPRSLVNLLEQMRQNYTWNSKSPPPLLHCPLISASVNDPMEKAKLRNHFQRLFSRLRRKKIIKASETGWNAPSPYENTHSPDATDQSKDGTVLDASQERIVALTRELGQLREGLAHDRAVSDEMLTNLLPVVQVHYQGFSEAICQFQDIIERIGRERHGTSPLL